MITVSVFIIGVIRIILMFVLITMVMLLFSLLPSICHHHTSSVCLSNFSLVIITKSITIIFPPPSLSSSSIIIHLSHTANGQSSAPVQTAILPSIPPNNSNMFTIQIGAVILHQQFHHNHSRLMLFTIIFRGRKRKAYCHCPQCCHHNDSCHSYDANGVSICGCDSDYITNMIPLLVSQDNHQDHQFSILYKYMQTHGQIAQSYKSIRWNNRNMCTIHH